MSLKKMPLSVLLTTWLVPGLAFAAEGAGDATMGLAVGASLAIGAAALGGTLGQGRAVAAALEGISRNPGAAGRIQTPMILGLALIESIVLFAWVIGFMLQSKIGG